MSIQVSKKSEMSGKIHTLMINTTEEKLSKWEERVAYGDAPFIQVFFPELSANEREFLMTGITPEEWDEMFGGQDEEFGNDNGTGE